MAVLLVLIFKDLKINIKTKVESKLIKYVSVTTFAVYIIHNHTMFDTLLTGSIGFIGQYNVVLMVLCLVGVILAIFIGCLLIDLIRQGIYKLFRIDKLFTFLGRKLDMLLHFLGHVQKV